MDLSASRNRTCGVRTGGELECWGDEYGDTPAGRFLRVDVHDLSYKGYGCAVAVDASVVCWAGSEWDLDWKSFEKRGQLDPPAGDFVDVSAGGGYACGLLADGPARCWGDNPPPPRRL